MDAGDSIKIYCRVRPTAQPSGFLSLAGKDEGEDCTSLLRFDVPPRATTHHGFEHAGVNNSRAQHNFRFDGVFDVDATQAQVFDAVGKPLVLSTLEGFNATAFAYGQTGSGKTFTTTGGAESYEDRGLIPRAVAMLFAECARRTDFVYTVHCSYLEIYNEHGYDLLDGRSAGGVDGEARGGTKHGIEGLHKLRYVHDEDGSGGYVHGLSVHHAANAEAALDLLFMGDTKRAVSSTAMNSVSSRSHAIFTLEIEARRPDSDVVRRSKLHIVDLAGSERVGKTGVAAQQQLTEAQYINKSLHYLEMVIVALQERHVGKTRGKGKSGAKAGRTHIPYRNSMMTSVLRDSLGGNCRTAMVATINGRAVHTDESVSTCRFAQRVAQVKNVAKMNESIDPQLLIQRLKEENQRLRDGGQGAEDESAQRAHALSVEEEDELRAEVLRFVSHPGAEPPKIDLTLGHGTLGRKGGAWFRARRAMCMLREVARRARGIGGETRPLESSPEHVAPEARPSSGDCGGAANQAHATAEALRRQTEIACRQALALLVLKRKQVTDETPASGEHLHFHPLADTKRAWADFNAANDALSRVPCETSQTGGGAAAAASSVVSDRFMFMDRQRQREKQEKLTAEARSCATEINSARSRIVQLKADLERERVRQAMAVLSVGEEVDEPSRDATAASSLQEANIVSSIECTKAKYQGGCTRLRSIKAEIEALRRASQRNTKRLVAQRRADFALWLDAMREFGLAPREDREQGSSDERSSGAIAATDAACAGAGTVIDAKSAKENVALAPGSSEKPVGLDAMSSRITELRSALRQQYALAKDAATEVSNARNEIKCLKSRQEALRVSADDDGAVALQPELERQKQLYREGFAELKALKRTISKLQHHLEHDASGRAKGVLEQRRQELMCHSASDSSGNVCRGVDDSCMRQQGAARLENTKVAWE